MKKKGLIQAGLVLLFLSAAAQAGLRHISEGNEAYSTGQFQLAELHYRKALEEDAANVTAQYNLANALHQQKKYKEAITLLKDVQENAANKNIRSAAYYNAGVAYSRQKDLEGSIEAYKNALRLNPDDEQARENLQKALLELKKEQQQKKQNSNQQSRMSQSEADRRLKQLQEKEKQLQQRLQKNSQQQGQVQPKDW